MYAIFIEEALVHQFGSGLSMEIQNLLLHHEMRETLQAIVKLVTRIDARVMNVEFGM